MEVVEKHLHGLKFPGKKLYGGLQRAMIMDTDRGKSTFYPRSSGPFYVVSYYIKWFTSSLTSSEKKFIYVSSLCSLNSLYLELSESSTFSVGDIVLAAHRLAVLAGASSNLYVVI